MTPEPIEHWEAVAAARLRTSIAWMLRGESLAGAKCIGVADMQDLLILLETRYAAAAGADLARELASTRRTLRIVTEQRDARDFGQAADRERIEALERENAELSATAAQKLVDATQMTGMLIGNGTADIGLEGGACGLLAEAFAGQFKDSGAQNHLTLTFESKRRMPGEGFLVTMQRRAGKTPHQLRQEAEADRDEARERVAVLQNALDLLAGLHPEPSTDDPEDLARRVFDHVQAGQAEHRRELAQMNENLQGAYDMVRRLNAEPTRKLA